MQPLKEQVPAESAVRVRQHKVAVPVMSPVAAKVMVVEAEFAAPVMARSATKLDKLVPLSR